jgi:hypothetical protein
MTRQWANESEARDLAQFSGTEIDLPCPTCGQKKRAPRTEQTRDATPKERSRVRIDIPVGEREHGYDDFMEMLGEARIRLEPELGYDPDTPNWYVLFAVLRDWLDSEPKTFGLRETGEAA